MHLTSQLLSGSFCSGLQRDLCLTDLTWGWRRPHNFVGRDSHTCHACILSLFYSFIYLLLILCLESKWLWAGGVWGAEGTPCLIISEEQQEGCSLLYWGDRRSYCGLARPLAAPRNVPATGSHGQPRSPSRPNARLGLTLEGSIWEFRFLSPALDSPNRKGEGIFFFIKRFPGDSAKSRKMPGSCLPLVTCENKASETGPQDSL